MATTTNFNWETPDDTDLVKDGAAAIRTLGSSIDTSFVDLKGGTTGQVLSKASNTDLDFTWVAQDDSNAIQNAIVDAKGDLISATAADTPARLAVGTNGQILTVDSTTATGLKWAAPAGGGKVLQVVQGFINTTTSTSSATMSDTGVTATITPTATTSKVLILVSLSGIGRTSGGAIDKVVNFKMQKNGSDLVQMNYYMLFNGTTNEILGASMATNYLDSPATTSATTYKVQWACDNGTSLIRLSYGSNISSITLLEIGA